MQEESVAALSQRQTKGESLDRMLEASNAAALVPATQLTSGLHVGARDSLTGETGNERFHLPQRLLRCGSMRLYSKLASISVNLDH
jgi:hypothetical protein